MPTWTVKGIGGVRFEIRLRENGHNDPHIHIIYAGEDISISLTTQKILAGKISNIRVRNRAIKWVRDNADDLIKEWRKYHHV